MYWLKILEITPKNHFALFERNDGEFGWLEMLMGDVEVGDILNEMKDKDFLKCKAMYCYKGKTQVRIAINGFGFEDDMRKEIKLYDNRI